MFVTKKTPTMPSPQDALPGRTTPLEVANQHAVNQHPLKPPFPAKLKQAIFGCGCFWGAERRFWEVTGVFTTAVGYTGGYTPNPTYEEVCTGLTGHTEAVLVVFDPSLIDYQQLLTCFWEAHDPTQDMRQGNDIGTQYRSAIYYFDADQQQAAETSRKLYQQALNARQGGQITTEIAPASTFYYAETYHQQYLAKNPRGYCGLGGTGVPFPT